MPKLCCGGRGGRSVEDPVVDIERLLVDFAWRELAEPSPWDRLMRHKRYLMDVNWSYFDISHRVIAFQPRSRDIMVSTGSGDGGGGVKEQVIGKRELCLFRTEFVNSSSLTQHFTFKTERTTTSRCDVSLQRGFRIGANVDVRISLPVSESSRITGGLSGELHVTKATGQTFEEVLTWSVDSQVQVEPRTRTTAALMIREEEQCADLTIESIIRPLYDRIPVYVRSRKTGRTLELLDIASNLLSSEILTENHGFTKVDSWAVRRETKGLARLVYGAEQIVDVRTSPLDDRTQPAVQSSSVVYQ